MARGIWHDPRRGDQPVDQWFRDWITSRAEVAERTRVLYLQVPGTWIDVPLTVERPTGLPRTVHLGAQTLASVTPADVRECDSTVLAQSTCRVTERWEQSRSMPSRVNTTIRRWAAQNGTALAQTGRIPTNPCLIKGASQRDTNDRAERKTATPQEAWAPANAMPERCRAAVIIAFCIGLRVGELFALRRRHVDPGAKAVLVEQSLARPGTGSGRFSSTETRAGRRGVATTT